MDDRIIELLEEISKKLDVLISETENVTSECGKISRDVSDVDEIRDAVNQIVRNA